MIAAPRCWIVGMNSVSSHFGSVIIVPSFLPPHSAWDTSGYCFFQAEDGIRDGRVTGVSDVCSSDLTTLAETVPGFESVGFYGISAPKGTPPEIVDILNKAVGEALKDPKLVARLGDVGGIPKPMTPAEFGKLVADETEKWRKVVEFAGVSVD